MKSPLWKYLGCLLVVVLAAFMIFICTCCKAYRITTGSMEPYLPEESIVLVLRRDRIPAEPVAGSVYAYQKGELTVIHRLIGPGSDGSGYEFRGDANNISDAGSVKDSQIIGKVILILK